MTWLSPESVPTAGLHHKMDVSKIAVVGIEGFLDFQPQMVADELQREGLQATSHYVHLPLLDRLRETRVSLERLMLVGLIDQKIWHKWSLKFLRWSQMRRFLCQPVSDSIVMNLT